MPKLTALMTPRSFHDYGRAITQGRWDFTYLQPALQKTWRKYNSNEAVKAFLLHHILDYTATLLHSPSVTLKSLLNLVSCNPNGFVASFDGWILETTHGVTATVMLSGSIPARGFIVVERGGRWLDSEDEGVLLYDAEGELIN